MKEFAVYLAVISVAAVLICCYDKLAARSKWWRVPEKVLFLLSALGGSVFMYITMRIIRHKTLHKRFMIGIPLIILLQIAIILLFYFKIL